jgi:hypothetical protein
MLDQIFGRLFLSQWIVFAVLLVLLVGVSELAWRMGFACSRGKSEADKDSGTVILIAIVIAIITDIDTPRSGLISVDERPLPELNETLSSPSPTTTP